MKKIYVFLSITCIVSIATTLTLLHIQENKKSNIITQSLQLKKPENTIFNPAYLKKAAKLHVPPFIDDHIFNDSLALVAGTELLKSMIRERNGRLGIYLGGKVLNLIGGYDSEQEMYTSFVTNLSTRAYADQTKFDPALALSLIDAIDEVPTKKILPMKTLSVLYPLYILNKDWDTILEQDKNAHYPLANTEWEGPIRIFPEYKGKGPIKLPIIAHNSENWMNEGEFYHIRAGPEPLIIREGVRLLREQEKGIDASIVQLQLISIASIACLLLCCIILMWYYSAIWGTRMLIIGSFLILAGVFTLPLFYVEAGFETIRFNIYFPLEVYDIAIFHQGKSLLHIMLSLLSDGSVSTIILFLLGITLMIGLPVIEKIVFWYYVPRPEMITPWSKHFMSIGVASILDAVVIVSFLIMFLNEQLLDDLDTKISSYTHTTNLIELDSYSFSQWRSGLHLVLVHYLFSLLAKIHILKHSFWGVSWKLINAHTTITNAPRSKKS